MIILNKKVSHEGFVDYLANLKMARTIDKIVMHHTSTHWKMWQGSRSMLHYWNLYRSRGMKTGAHIFIAPDGIWLFTPIEKEGTHAGEEGNKNSIGIEIVGDWSDCEPDHPKICEHATFVVRKLALKFKLPITRIYSHVDFDKNTFCSHHVGRSWIGRFL